MSSALKLPKDGRNAVSKALEEVASLQEEEDTPEALDSLVESMSKIFNVICDKPAKLLKDLDDDDPHVMVALMSRVLSEWAKETQLGEA